MKSHCKLVFCYNLGLIPSTQSCGILSTGMQGKKHLKKLSENNLKWMIQKITAPMDINKIWQDIVQHYVYYVKTELYYLCKLNCWVFYITKHLKVTLCALLCFLNNNLSQIRLLHSCFKFDERIVVIVVYCRLSVAILPHD